jgi:hypothetical protein
MTDTVDTGISGALTDGSGIGTFTASKVFKDFVVDLLKTGAALLISVGVTSVPQATAQPLVVWGALAGAAISAVYRAVLKWAESS